LASLIATVRRRLSAGGFFGLQILAGGVVLVGAAWLFGGIAEDVVEGDPLTVLDADIAGWFHAHAVSPVTQFMLGLSAMNGIAGISILTLMLALFLVWKREWHWLFALALAVPGGMLLNELAKLAFHRVRPSFTDPIMTLSSYSFPSGHTVASTLFYGTLAAFLVPRAKMPGQRVAILSAAFLMVILVGFSRIYLGAHFLSDVVAGFAEGLAWLAICLVAAASLRRRQATRKSAA
jgi:membrane-associated phospholipid phosphatase